MNALRTGPTARLAVWWVLPRVRQVKQARWSHFTHCQLYTEMIKCLYISRPRAIVDPVVGPTEKDPKMYLLTSLILTIWLVVKLTHETASDGCLRFPVLVLSLTPLFHSGASVSLILPVEL